MAPDRRDNLHNAPTLDYCTIHTCNLCMITIRTILNSIQMLPLKPKSITIMGGGQFNKNLMDFMSCLMFFNGFE